MFDRRHAEDARAVLAEIRADRRELTAAWTALTARAKPAALAALAAGMAVEEVAAACGFSVKTVEGWAAKSRATAARRMLASGVDAKVLHVLRSAAGPVRNRDVAAQADLRTGTVSKSVRRLVATGRAVKNPDGTLSPVMTSKNRT